MGKSSKNQTVTQQVDPRTMAMQQEVFNLARGAAGMAGGTGNVAAPIPGAHGFTFDAARGFGGVANAGQQGLAALLGEPAAMAQFTNPFEQQVAGALGQQFGDLRQRVMMEQNDAATQAGAFGGSRHGVATGVALGEAMKGEQSALANLRYGGFNDGMQRAGNLAGMGMQANGQLAGLGDYLRQVQISRDPAMQRLGIMQGALGGQTPGMSTTQPVNRNLAAGALGGAASLGGLGAALGATGPMGWGIAGLGALLGVL